jgi:hypothetical protein
VGQRFSRGVLEVKEVGFVFDILDDLINFFGKGGW